MKRLFSRSLGALTIAAVLMAATTGASAIPVARYSMTDLVAGTSSWYEESNEGALVGRLLVGSRTLYGITSHANTSGTAYTDFGRIHASVIADQKSGVYLPPTGTYLSASSQALAKSSFGDLLLFDVKDGACTAGCDFAIKLHFDGSTSRPSGAGLSGVNTLYKLGQMSYQFDFDSGAGIGAVTVPGFQPISVSEVHYGDRDQATTAGYTHMLDLFVHKEWTVTGKIYKDSSLNYSLSMDLRAGYVGSLIFENTGAIDSIVVPEGVTVTSMSGAVEFRDGVFAYREPQSPIDEPQAAVLLACGLIALYCHGRRRRRAVRPTE